MTHASDPIARFQELLTEARAREPFDASRAAFATASTDGDVSVRFVLAKHVEEGRFVIYTNLQSPKARDLKSNPRASLAFHWSSTGVQVRVSGRVGLVDEAMADAYFASRPRGSQLGAWASRQSEPLAGRQALLAAVAELDREYAGRDVPRPPFWSGYELVPQRIEFWHNHDDRLHDRFLFVRNGNSWEQTRLSP